MKHYYKIHEISELYDIGIDSLRYYEEIGILHPKRGANGYRLYGTKEIYQLNILKDMRKLGFSFAQIKEYLSTRTMEDTQRVFQEEIQAIEKQKEELERMEKSLWERIDNLESIKTIELNTFKIKSYPNRKANVLTSPLKDRDDIERQLVKLGNDYAQSPFVIANFNTGALINIKHEQYESAFILADDEHANTVFPEGRYITYAYQSNSNDEFKVVRDLKDYLHAQHLEAEGLALEFLMIDTHETLEQDEYLNQLEIKIKD